MRLDRSELSKAVQTALSLGAVAAVGVAGTAFAQNATTTQNGQNNPQTLQTIVVTGSHIRRVDLETSNPVVAVTSQQIQQTGKLTLGGSTANTYSGLTRIDAGSVELNKPSGVAAVPDTQ